MKRTVLGIAVSMAFSSMTYAHALYPQDAAGLNLRQGPGTQHPVVAVLGPGESARVLNRQGDWFQVRTRDGRQAWAAAWVARVVYDSPWTGEVTASALNVRRGPGTGHPRVATLPHGTRVQVTESEGDWYRIRGGSVTGWVAAAYIRAVDQAAPSPGQPPPAPSPAPSPGSPPAPGIPAPPGGTLHVQVDKAAAPAVAQVRVRRGSHLGYDAVDTVRAGESLRYLESAGGWVQVVTPRNVKGWIHGQYLALWDQNTPFAQAPLYLVEPGQWRVDFPPVRIVTASKLWLRTGPSGSHGTVTLMPNGTALKVLGQQGGWIRVRLADGRTGWCAGEYTAAYPQASPRVSSVSLKQTAPGVMRLEITGRLEGLAIQPVTAGQGLLFAVPDANGRPAHLQVGDGAVTDLTVAGPGVQIRFASSPAYTVLEQSAGKAVVEFRPAVIGASRLEAPGRTIYRLALAGDVPPGSRADGEQVVLDLPGALLKAELPAGLTAQTLDGRLRLLHASRHPFVLKRHASGLDLVVMAPGLAGKVIMLDPGHGGADHGAVAASGLREKDFNLQVASRLKARLEQAGATVLLTRDWDRLVAPTDLIEQTPPEERLRADLDSRTRLANQAGVDLFLSIHANASGIAGDRGTETFWSVDNFNADRSRLLATLVQRELVAELGRVDRGVKTDLFYVTRFVEAPSALAEVAFLSDRTEAALLADPAVQDRTAAALYRALDQFFASR